MSNALEQAYADQLRVSRESLTSPFIIDEHGNVLVSCEQVTAISINLKGSRVKAEWESYDKSKVISGMRVRIRALPNSALLDARTKNSLSSHNWKDGRHKEQWHKCSCTFQIGKAEELEAAEAVGGDQALKLWEKDHGKAAPDDDEMPPDEDPGSTFGDLTDE